MLSFCNGLTMLNGIRGLDSIQCEQRCKANETSVVDRHLGHTDHQLALVKDW